MISSPFRIADCQFSYDRVIFLLLNNFQLKYSVVRQIEKNNIKLSLAKTPPDADPYAGW